MNFYDFLVDTNDYDQSFLPKRGRAEFVKIEKQRIYPKLYDAATTHGRD